MNDVQAADATISRATTKHVRMSPRKLRVVADLVRGMPVVEAWRILNFNDRDAALPLRKTIDSAAANAENGDSGLSADELYVSEIFVDEGPTLKRWLPRARGRATRIRKRTSHINVRLAEIPEEDE